MFVEINLQDLDKLSQSKRIYWGRAKLYNNQSHYNILFTNYFTLNSEQIRPSIYIKPQLIEETFCRTLMEKKFRELSNCSIYCFIYAKPYPKKSNNKTFINFYIDNLDFLEIKQEF